MLVRGTALKSLLSAIEERFGAAGLARVHAALPPEIRRRLEQPIQPASSYPVEVSAAIHEALKELFGAGESRVNHELGALAARADFGGIHRVFIRVADYETLLRATERAWGRYNSHGKVSWPHIGKGEATAIIQYVKGFTEPMWQAIGGRLETVLILGGAKRVDVAVASWSESEVRFELRWS